MAGFFTMFKRLNSNNFGVVTGSDFRNGSLPYAYLGRGEKENKDKLMIYGEKLDDFVFGREDVESAKVLQQETYFKMGSNQQKKGSKYEIKFKNGKVAIIAIPANDAYRLESVIF